MPRTYDPARTCLPMVDWPEDDKALWTATVTPGDPEDETGGSGAAWRPTTAKGYRKGYGRWLTFLKLSGAGIDTAPAERVTPELVKAYRQELDDQGLKPLSVWSRIRELHCVIKAFAPDRDWRWLKDRTNRLRAIASDARCQDPVTMLTGDILERALKALDVSRPAGDDPRSVQAIAFRNWLMVAALSLMPLRRHNFANVSITRNLRRDGNIWMIKIPAEESKTQKAIGMPVPAVLHRHFQFYFDHVRPTLLAGRSSDRLWISFHHTAMSDHSVYIAMTDFTRKVFGAPINPHRYRHIGATTVVMAAPEMMEAARAFLGHGDTQTTKEFYIIGESLTASRQHAGLIGKLRRRLPAPSPEPALVLPACGRDAKLAKGKAA
jgi:integrase